MILHFHAQDAREGESAYLNICTNPENYNFNIYTEPHIHYIEISRADLDAIYKELDFNCFWHVDDLQASHEDKSDPARQAGAFWREFIPR